MKSARPMLVAICLGFGIAGLVWAIQFNGFEPTRVGGDEWNYLAAGERLNAGHPLYSLSPGDRIVPLKPPQWSVPLLAPPPIAVAWRPLALLGEPSMVLWGLACLVVSATFVIWLAIRGGLMGLTVIAGLAVPIAITAIAGNISAILIGTTALMWTFRSRPRLVGALLAAAIAVKLTPVTFIVWLVAARRWSALLWSVMALGLIGVLSLAFAGVDAHFAWLKTVPSAAPSQLSLSALTGLPTAAIQILMLGLVALSALSRSERVVFAAAVVGSALASPAIYLQTIGWIAAGAVPWVQPRRENEEASVRRPESAVQVA